MRRLQRQQTWGRDTRLSRCGKKIGSRLELWNQIEEAQLKELPPSEICRQIFTTGVQVRTVGGDLAISIVHPNVKTSLRYSLRSLPNIMVGMTVNVQPLLVTDDAVRVSYKNDSGGIEAFEVKPIEYSDVGFDMSAPVFGAGGGECSVKAINELPPARDFACAKLAESELLFRAKHKMHGT